MTAHIRPYQPEDLESVLTTWESANRLAHPFMSEAFIKQTRIDIKEIYLPNTQTWVAEINGWVVGFISLMGNEIGAVFLQPKYHALGIGKALLEQVKSVSAELEVEVFQLNTIGRKFYARYGFKQIEKKLHPPTGQQVLRLRLVSL